MEDNLLNILRCPVTRSSLELQISRLVPGTNTIEEGILFAQEHWFYPIIGGIPRMGIESFIDYKDFLASHLPDYNERAQLLKTKYAGLIKYVTKKNKRTKKSFSFEWNVYQYGNDRTWDENKAGMLQRFLNETDETIETLAGKYVFDAGCGNGVLNQYLAEAGAVVIGMDFSESVEKAYQHNTSPNALFLQGDVQFPPVAFNHFDIVHSSGVLIHTPNPELSFSCIDPCIKELGKMSVWLYHPRKDLVHNLFNFLRKFTSKLPIRLQYYLYLFTLFPASYIVKRLKGNKQNKREMMVDIMDWFSPEFRHEHEPAEVATWFSKRNYSCIKQTTASTFGFNMIGVKRNLRKNESSNF
jgi:SAM-dependent methyltransferase/uncharacterized protein YbaR (Trm112 family)